jgi:hypothetical protein
MSKRLERTNLKIAVLVAVFMFATGVRAESLSDIDVRAAYCVGALLPAANTLRTNIEIAKGREGDRVAVSSWSQQLSEYQNRLDRLNSYLKSRRGETSEILAEATRRGEADNKQGATDVLTCYNSCAGRTLDQFDACRKKCGQGGHFEEIRRCNDLSWLPSR